MKINERWEEWKEESNKNIQSEKEILNRQTRSIQTEEHFGDINKYHRFLRDEIKKYEEKKESFLF